MKKAVKVMFKSMLIVLFLFMGGLSNYAQVRTIKVSGDIKGLDAMKVCIMGGDRGEMPREVGSGIADKGKFQITFKEDPSLGKRYVVYIPSLDNESRTNNDSRHYFFVDGTDILFVGRMKNDGFKEFDAPGSKMFQEFKNARAKIDFSKYKKLGIAEGKAHAEMADFASSKDETRTGIPMSDADSVILKEKKQAWKGAAQAYFDAEYALGLQALDQVGKMSPSRGLNALVSDFFGGTTKESLQPAIDKYLEVFGVDYMRQDFYLKELYESYKRLNMNTKGMEIVDFQFVDLKGRTVSFGDLKGKFVYVNFWDVEDPDFQVQQDALELLGGNYKNNKDIVIVNLSVNEDQDTWKARMTGMKSKCIQLSVTGDSYFYRAYKVRELPRSVLLDKEGRMLEFHMGVPTNPQTREYLDELLK